MSATAEAVTGRSTTMQALKPAESTPVQQLPAVSMGFASLQSFELMQRAAKLLSASSLVPESYQGNLPNCVIALNMAQRLGADPLMVMQNLYVVYGRPAWSAQFLIACFNQCGRYTTMRFRWTGTKGKDNWGCVAYSRELATGEEIEGPEITIALAKEEGWYDKKGSKWKTIPQLMLMYRAAAWLVRTHAPELSMGLQTDQEVHDVYDARRTGAGDYQVTTESLRQAAASTEETEPEPRPDMQTWIDTLNGCTSLEQLKSAWVECCKAFHGDAPIDCEATWNTRRETLLETEGRQSEL